MLQAMIPPNNNTDNIPVLNERSLKRYADTEYDSMTSEIEKVVKEKHQKTQGKSFAQFSHDDAVLFSGKRHNLLVCHWSITIL